MKREENRAGRTSRNHVVEDSVAFGGTESSEKSIHEYG